MARRDNRKYRTDKERGSRARSDRDDYDVDDVRDNNQNNPPMLFDTASIQEWLDDKLSYVKSHFWALSLGLLITNFGRINKAIQWVGSKIFHNESLPDSVKNVTTGIISKALNAALGDDSGLKRDEIAESVNSSITAHKQLSDQLILGDVVDNINSHLKRQFRSVGIYRDDGELSESIHANLQILFIFGGILNLMDESKQLKAAGRIARLANGLGHFGLLGEKFQDSAIGRLIVESPRALVDILEHLPGGEKCLYQADKAESKNDQVAEVNKSDERSGSTTTSTAAPDQQDESVGAVSPSTRGEAKGNKAQGKYEALTNEISNALRALKDTPYGKLYDLLNNNKEVVIDTIPELSAVLLVMSIIPDNETNRELYLNINNNALFTNYPTIVKKLGELVELKSYDSNKDIIDFEKLNRQLHIVNDHPYDSFGMKDIKKTPAQETVSAAIVYPPIAQELGLVPAAEQTAVAQVALVTATP